MKSVIEQHPVLSQEARVSLDFVLRAAAVLFRQRASSIVSSELDQPPTESNTVSGPERQTPLSRS